MIRISPRGFSGLAFICLALVARATESSASSSADVDLICLTDNSADCYPRLFQPTKDFQVIKEGQDIPPGLHVRMNVYDGVKEARLNIPMEGEEGGELQGIPVEQAMVVVDNSEVEAVEELVKEQKAMRDQVPQQPPAYEAAGKIPIPPPENNGGDMGTFKKALLTITMEARAFDSALDDLSDLAHDIYYGVEIAKSGPVLEKLVCLTLGSGSDKFPAKEQKRDQKAAGILASAIQNNPTALKEVADMGRIIMFPNCPADVLEPQKKGQNNFVGLLRTRLGREKDPAALKSKIKAISGLIKEPTIRRQFLESRGMEMLLAIWLKKGEQWDSVREKVAQLIMDNFLDEGMGAELGVWWPKKPRAETEVCETKNMMLDDACWEHHVKVFSKASPGLTWAGDFLKNLEEQRPKSAVRHMEL